MDTTENGYFTFIIKTKFFFNSVFGSFEFSAGDGLYSILAVLLIYWSVRGIIRRIKKEQDKPNNYPIKILITLNILYLWFMVSFGLLYNYRNFPQYGAKEEKVFLNEYKTVAGNLLNDCRALREEVTVNRAGEFSVNRENMIKKLYLEQSVFYGIPQQKPNLKKSWFSSVMKKIGIFGYYNPFTGEAQVAEGFPDVSLPFTLAHEMGHQVGVAREDEANFYSFYMGESSADKDFQYSVKYKALNYLLREIYVNDSTFVKRVLDNYSEGMKKDREKEKKYYEQMSGFGSDAFSYMNHAYLKSNDQEEGIVAYNNVSKMIVNFYKKNHPSLFKKEEYFNYPKKEKK
ncbi:MAG: DUF3810 domain-containing protein [Flavobacteriaceae bacterium]|nr:DUF3810 domain-containing protein [Flavobacteriaceae bacterium]